MKSHDVFRSFLYENDVDTVFSLISDGTKKLLANLGQDDGMRVIEARHEQNAMAMADGYARATGDIGVCVVGRGPGIAQTGTSLVTSKKQGTKLLVLIAESPLRTDYDSKGFDQEAYLKATVEDVVTIRSTDLLARRVASVFKRLKRGDGPIAVQIPWDLMNADYDPGGDWDASTYFQATVDMGGRLQPTDEAIEAAIDHYLDSDASIPPLLLAGRGAYESGATDAIEDLASRTGAMLATTLQGRGMFANHPYAIGFVGTFGTNLANDYFNQSDFVLAVGCSLNPHTTDDGRFLEDSTVVHIDTDPSTIERHATVDLGIHGDARETVRAIEYEMAALEMDFSDKFWTDKRQENIASTSALDEREFPATPDRIDPRALVRKLDDILPEKRLIITDGGHFVNFVLDGITVASPRDFVWSLDFASIGQGVPMGIGSAVADDDRACITFCGDAGFMMTSQELNTMAREDLPVRLVVMNDELLGSEYHQLDLAGKNAAAAKLATPDLADIAREFGVDGYTVRSVDNLESISDELSKKPNGPSLVDCKIDPEVRHRFYQDLHGF
jgi:thiamine pyrophosphate-dependent acetolactate synthase large subunit-like protein